MSRSVVVYGLLLLLIGIAAFGIWVLGHLGNESGAPSTGSPAASSSVSDTHRDNTVSKPSRPAKRRFPKRNWTPGFEPVRDPVVSVELASELDLTSAEREQLNTLIAEIETRRRELFDDVSTGGRTVDDVSEEIGDLRAQLGDDIRDLLGDERADALFHALR